MTYTTIPQRLEIITEASYIPKIQPSDLATKT